MPDVHYGDASHYVAGDTGMSKWTVTGTTATGQKIRARGCDFYTFRDGLVVVKDSYWKNVEA
jgi:ketosteroid isomerase-like protein